MQKKGFFLILMFMAVLFGTSCGSKATVKEGESPKLVNVRISSYNEGTETSQYVRAELIFDKDISIASDTAKSLRITIADERIKEDEYTLTMGEDGRTAEFTISVEAITEGILKIGKAEKADVIYDILSADGSFASEDFTVEGIIPSGVILSSVDSQPGKVTKQVDSSWNIRSIAWIGISENGTLIPVSETQKLEMLDGYAAVHGHEFLMEDEDDIAKKMVEVLQNNYGSEYTFSQNGNQVTVEKADSEDTLDIVIYQYLKIDGQRVSQEMNGQDDENQSSDETVGADSEHEQDIKVKMIETDREVTDEEQTFLDRLHTASLGTGNMIDGTDLYTILTITGEAMPEEQIYSVRDLEDLLADSFQNEKMYEFGLPMEQGDYIGLNFSEFLSLCGADLDQKDLTLYMQSSDTTYKSYRMDELEEAGAQLFLALSGPDGALTNESSPVSGPMAICVSFNGTEEWVESVMQVRIGTGDVPVDPQYGYHNREPYLDSADKTFTVEVYQEGAQYLGAVKTAQFTTAEMEKMMDENPEAVVTNYYGTIGNEEIFQYMGVGGWLDCFKGLDLCWLLTSQVGLTNFSGRAELVGRDGEMYGTIDDLSYIAQSKEKSSEYYTLTSEGVKIPGAVPMIGFIKNGCPILPEHDHESAAYVAYNRLNQRLEESGISVETGVVKNHNGPFVACLGNRDGYYGGNQIETGGDCVLMRIYVNGNVE